MAPLAKKGGDLISHEIPIYVQIMEELFQEVISTSIDSLSGREAFELSRAP